MLKVQNLNVIDLNALVTSMGFRASAPPPQERKIGVDYLPPNNAVIKHDLTPKSVEEHVAGSSGARKPSTGSSFDWRKVDADAIGKPRNQMACGSCWSLGTIDVLADRFAILTRSPRDTLSVTYLLSCDHGGLGCDGGSSSDAAAFLQKTGTPDDKCMDYSWCVNDANCAHGLTTVGLNSKLPTCTQKCSAPTTFELFKIKDGSVRFLSSTDHIKREISTSGPVVASYRVWGDFIVGTLPKSKNPASDGWKATAGIYMHHSGRDIYKYPTMTSQGSKKKPYQSDMGNHVVGVVGWGSQSVSGYGTVPYWIVRNSWGEKWNGDGYFKIAFSNPKTGINMDVGLDRTIDISGSKYGGMITFLPDTSLITDPSPSSSISMLPQENRHAMRPRRSWFSTECGTVYFAAVCVFLVAMVFFILWLRWTRMPLQR